jgi:hypothetical protein
MCEQVGGRAASGGVRKDAKRERKARKKQVAAERKARETDVRKLRVRQGTLAEALVAQRERWQVAERCGPAHLRGVEARQAYASLVANYAAPLLREGAVLATVSAGGAWSTSTKEVANVLLAGGAVHVRKEDGDAFDPRTQRNTVAFSPSTVGFKCLLSKEGLRLKLDADMLVSEPMRTMRNNLAHGAGLTAAPKLGDPLAEVCAMIRAFADLQQLPAAEAFTEEAALLPLANSAGLLLKLHSKGRVPITKTRLKRMVESIKKAKKAAAEGEVVITEAFRTMPDIIAEGEAAKMDEEGEDGEDDEAALEEGVRVRGGGEPSASTWAEEDEEEKAEDDDDVVDAPAAPAHKRAKKDLSALLPPRDASEVAVAPLRTGTGAAPRRFVQAGGDADPEARAGAKRARAWNRES